MTKDFWYKSLKGKKLTKDFWYKSLKGKKLSLREIEKQELSCQLHIEAYKNHAEHLSPYNSGIDEAAEAILELKDKMSALKELRNEEGRQ